jgi:hypothetical protein
MVEQFLNIIDAFNRFNVNYVLIGGIAINIYGFQRGTQDIDIFVQLEEGNIENLRSALKSLYKDDSINEITVAELEKYAVIRYGTENNFFIDIISKIGELFSFSDLEYKELEWEGHKIKIATEETLLRMKSNSYREIDAADVIFLKKIIENKNAGI